MFSAISSLSVYFIDFNTTDEAKISKTAVALKAASLLVGGPLALLKTATGLKALGADGVSLKRLIDNNRFNIIKTQDELNEYKNANGNEWVKNDKALKQRQCYVRHPKISKQNILIEAKSFYDFIEKEQKSELINYILSHCPAKSIRIDKVESVESNSSGNGTVKGAELSGSVNYGKMIGNYYSNSNPNGLTQSEPRENYIWLDEFFMESILSLSEGASFSQTYESDFTFGLSGSEAKTIGLDLGHHKKFSYTIQVEC